MNKETLPTNHDENDLEDAASSMMEQLEEYLTDGEYDYQTPKRGDIHTGVVIEIGDRGAIVDAGFKRDGIVPPSDLDRLDEESRAAIMPGDEVAVAVTKPHDKEGRLILSVYQALVQEDWIKAEEMLENGELYEGEISGYNRGGLLVPFGRIRGFIPSSHTVGMPRGLKGDERRERLADMVGDKVGLKVIEVDRHRRRLILSQRQARRAWQRMQRKRVMDELEEGKVASGKVTGITDFGAFVDLGGADGLVHISELSWRQVDDPREVVEVGDEVDVYVLSLDWERTRIALSLKRLKPNPWSEVADHYEVGELVEGRVSRVLDFGAFVQLKLGVEGLLHISEMTGASQLSPTEILKVGQRVLVKIIGIDARKQRITLSARQVHRDQWERWMAEHQIEEEPEEAAEEPAPAEAEALEPTAPEAVAVPVEAEPGEDGPKAEAEVEAEAEELAEAEEEALAEAAEEPEDEELEVEAEAEELAEAEALEPAPEVEAKAEAEELAEVEEEALAEVEEDGPEAEPEAEAEELAEAAEEELAEVEALEPAPEVEAEAEAEELAEAAEEELAEVEALEPAPDVEAEAEAEELAEAEPEAEAEAPEPAPEEEQPEEPNGDVAEPAELEEEEKEPEADAEETAPVDEESAEPTEEAAEPTEAEIEVEQELEAETATEETPEPELEESAE
jgi:small subunit ribosomal protein S1